MKSRTDTERLDFMERHLRRDGSVMGDETGKTWQPKNAWAIAGELDTLRETVDAMMDAMH